MIVQKKSLLISACSEKACHEHERPLLRL
jgi:hypothetical protein